VNFGQERVRKPNVGKLMMHQEAEQDCEQSVRNCLQILKENIRIMLYYDGKV